LIYLAKQAGVEVYPSIGGWTLSDPFPAMAASEPARTKFAQQCVELIKSYDFDGKYLGCMKFVCWIVGAAWLGCLDTNHESNQLISLHL
jgi:hypothetical protein